MPENKLVPMQGPAVRWYTSADGERKSYQPVHLAGFLAESALVQG